MFLLHLWSKFPSDDELLMAFFSNEKLRTYPRAFSNFVCPISGSDKKWESTFDLSQFSLANLIKCHKLLMFSMKWPREFSLYTISSLSNSGLYALWFCDWYLAFNILPLQRQLCTALPSSLALFMLTEPFLSLLKHSLYPWNYCTGLYTCQLLLWGY